MDEPIDTTDEKFPLRENCDPTDPDEMFWWMFASLPGMNNAFFLMPIVYYRLVSKRLYDLGARVKCDACGHAAEPTLKLQLPPSGDPQWATGQGKWVPIDTPDVEVPLVRRAVDALSPADRAAFFKELARRADADNTNDEGGE
ncbi:phage gene 29 protein family protein [Rhodococcoides corynebacterioides]|uniref:phage gene 29 protein family protein n=1 Tax=Rhodococcoides corynebacterioides TaxID=53972 RepID=UPI003F81A978